MVKRLSLGKWIDGSMRLRISAPGFDVDNPGLTKDQIVFDSTLSGYGPVYASGSFYVGSNSYSNQLVAAWPTLPSVPVIRMSLSLESDYDPNYGWLFRSTFSSGNDNGSDFRVRCTPGGILLNGSLGGSWSQGFTMGYVVTAQI